MTMFRDIAAPFRIQGSNHLSMVKFEDQGQTEYQNFENLIIKMIRPVHSTREAEDSLNAQHQETSNASATHAGGVSTMPWVHGRGSSLSQIREAPETNFYVKVEHQQGPFSHPSRQQTHPIPYRFPPNSNSNPQAPSGPTASYSDFQPRPVSRAQTEHISNSTNDESPFNRLGLFDWIISTTI